MTTQANPPDAERQPEHSQDEAHAQPPPTADPDARRIAEVSPEGIPADPKTDRRTIGRILTGSFLVVAIVSVLLAIFVNPWIGLICGVLAVLLMLINPVLWASLSRMKERENI
ncbi:MAG: hypothetical protein NCW75_07295 [Phycisphaera sp.]|nr:MAG: hypothetical protein NCW75_07295 [Phycisphaera sp.]